MWCWRRMEKISWTDHVRNEEVLLRMNEQRNILHEIRKWKAKWIGHILHRNCLIWQVIEGKIKGEMEVTRRRCWRCKKLLDDLREGRRYSHLKEEALYHIMWRNRFGGGIGPVIRQATEWMKEGLLENASQAFITIFLNINNNLKIQVDNVSLPISLLKNAYPNSFSWMNIIPVTGEIWSIIYFLKSKNTSSYDGMSTKILSCICH